MKGLNAKESIENEALIENTRSQVFDAVLMDSYTGVAVAGAIYGLLVFVYSQLLPDLDFGLPLGSIAWVLLGCGTGYLLTGIFSMLSVAFISIVVRSCEAKPSPEFAAANAGGLTGYAMLVLLLFASSWGHAGATNSSSFLYFVLGPILAMLFGQIGAVWVAVDSCEGHIERRSESSGLDQSVLVQAVYHSGSQFDLRQLSFGVVVAAAMLGLVKFLVPARDVAFTTLLLSGWMFLTLPTSLAVCKLIKSIRSNGP